MKRILSLVLIAMLLLCSMSSVVMADAAEATTFTFITPTDNEPASLSQLQGGTGDYYNNAYLLYAPLFRNHDGAISNELCEDYTVSEDGLVYTLKLRDAKYADGVEIKAQDFVFMMKSYLDPNNGATQGSDYSESGIVNALEFYQGTVTDFSEVGFKALDDKTLEITLVKPNDSLLRLMATNVFSPLREDVLAAYGDAMGSTPDKTVCSGPYILTEWTSGTAVVMEKNPNYWNAENSFPTDKIVHLLVGDSNTIYSLYESGEADAIVNLDAEYVDLVGEDLMVSEGNRLEILWMNMSGQREETAALMGNKNFRQALNYALNREAIVAAISPNHDPYARVVAPMSVDADGNRVTEMYDIENVPLSGDLEKAKQYLATALEELGYASVADLPTLQFVTYENSLLKLFAETMIDQWKQLLGLTNIEFHQYGIGTALGMIYDADFDFFFIGNTGAADPAGLMDAFLPGGGYDFGNWYGEDYEAFVAAYAAMEGKTGAEYIEALKATEQAYTDTAILFPIYRANEVHAAKSYVSGMKLNVIGKGYAFDELVIAK